MTSIANLMPFARRLKKEMSEGMVRAVLEHAGYVVTDTGIEKLLSGLNCLTGAAYLDLDFPLALRKLPDFVVMTPDHREKHLVEVKYRSDWNTDIFSAMREQVVHFREIILISINAKAKDPRGYNGPSRYLRCCSLRYMAGTYQVELRGREGADLAWHDVTGLSDHESLWWQMVPLTEKFPRFNEETCKGSLREAVDAIRGILDRDPPDPRCKSERFSSRRIRRAGPEASGSRHAGEKA